MFAYLGGELFMYEGLLDQAKSAEELAGVIAHEVAHVEKRHILEGVLGRTLIAWGFSWFTGGTGAESLLQNVMLLKFTSSQESEADRGALVRLRAAKVGPDGLLAFFERMERKSSESSASTLVSFMSDHPADQARAKMMRDEPKYEVSPILTADEWTALQGYCR
jgi:predicted Zn-dependent protease